jgi:hypothetical protein
MNRIAPVVIPTLNRYQHFRRCIESLAKCSLADQTELYIFLDFPLKESHVEGWKKIKEFLPHIKGFKDVIVIERNSNFGAIKNFFSSLDYVFERHDKLIFTEDDNVFSNDFLYFVNSGLNTYENRNDVFSVSGYHYPVFIPKKYTENVYLWKGFSAWGVGLWKEKWYKINFEQESVMTTIRSFFKQYYNMYRFNRVANHYLGALLNILTTNRITADGFVSLSLFLNNNFSVFPTISRVRNYGHDGSGENGGVLLSNIYRDQPLYEGTSDYLLNLGLRENRLINQSLSHHFRRPLVSKVRTLKNIISMNFFVPK